jgi:hypothetical protein
MPTNYTMHKQKCPSCESGEYSFEESGDDPPQLKSDYVTCSHCPNDHRIKVRKGAQQTWIIEVVETIARR